MSRERFRRVAEFWNWLPAFRGVAEHESIHGAAQALGVSPSALSRTVKLLEDAVGGELFVRHGTGLTLTPLGAELLTSTRAAMRVVDDCLGARDDLLARRTIFVGATSSAALAGVAHALLERQPKEPRAVFHVRSCTDEAVLDHLLRGDLDIAIASTASAAPGILVERVGEARYGVFAAPDHELALRAGQLAADGLRGARFVAPSSGDGWPRDAERTALVIADSLEVALTMCEKGGFLCVLPDLFRAHHGLTRLCDLPPVALHVVRRAPLANQDTRLLDELVDSLRRHLANR